MHRIDNVTAAASLPTPASAGTAGYFSNATPGSGTPTIVDNDWCNDIQEELISILTAASVAPSKTTHNQVLTALEDLFPLKAGVLLAANNLSDVSSPATSLTNLGGLKASNNLSDLGTLATALTNLGFAGGSGYFKIPNAANTAKPWIIQYGSASSTLAGQLSSFPITFPNNMLFLKTQNNYSSNVIFAEYNTSTSTFTLSNNSGTATVPYFALGN